MGLFWVQLIKTDTVSAPKCQYKSITGKDCPTCGITRDFVSISDFKKEEELINSKSIYYFYFFVYIAVSRLIAVVYVFFKEVSKQIVVVDIIISTLIFIALIVFAYFLIE